LNLSKGHRSGPFSDGRGRLSQRDWVNARPPNVDFALYVAKRYREEREESGLAENWSNRDLRKYDRRPPAAPTELKVDRDETSGKLMLAGANDRYRLGSVERNAQLAGQVSGHDTLFGT
jgi:hypothetical protein